MALVLADRVKETTDTTGTGTYSLSGGLAGFQTFNSAIGNGNTTYYTCTDGNNFEIGIGTYTSSGNTLARTTILKSSNSNSAVNWGVSTKDIFVTYPADKSVFKDASDNISGLGTASALDTGISNNNVPKFTSGVADDDFLRVSGTTIEGRSASQVLSDIGAITADSTTTLTNKTIDASQLSGNVANARLDAQLQDVAGLAVTDSGFIVGDGSNFVLETGATVRTSLGLGTVATLDTGISNTNIPKFTSGVADDDFLRVDGTSIEGRSASQVLSDIGGQASLTFGKSDTNALKLEEAVTTNDILLAGSSNVKGRTYAELKSDLSLDNVENTALSTGTALNATHVLVTDNESTNEENLITFVEGATSTTGNVGLEMDGNLTYNPSSGNLTATQLTGTLQTAAQTNITSLGTLTTLTVDNVIVNGTTIGHTDDTDLITLADGVATVTGDLTLTSTGGGATDDPSLILYRNSSSPADYDDLGEIIFRGRNDNSQDVDYARIWVEPFDVSDGTEGARLRFDNILYGSETNIFATGWGFLYLNHHLYFNASKYIMFEGATDDGNETILTVADPTADRTITLPDATGTVITTGNMNSITDIGIQQYTIQLGAGADLQFEGATANDYETTLTVTDPTADRTITLPNATGTVALKSEYFQAYISSNSSTLTDSFVIIDFDTVTLNSDASILAESGGEVTINKTGIFRFHVDVTVKTTSGSNRSDAEIEIQKQPSGGAYSSVTGTTAVTYNRTNNLGDQTASIDFLISVTSGDTYKVMVKRQGGSGTLVVQGNAARFNIQEVN